MHHALGQSGGARRVHDVQRMIERQSRERRLAMRGVLLQHVGEGHCTGDARELRCGVDIRHHPDRGQRRQRCHDLAHTFEAVDLLAGVPVAVGGDEYFGGDLSEPIEHALGAEVGRARRPHCTQRRGRQHRDHGLRKIRQVAHDAIAHAHTGGRQRGGGGGHLRRQLGEADALLRAVLVPRHDRHAVIAPTQQMLGEIESRIREPSRSTLGVGRRHPVAAHQDIAPR